MGSAQPRLAPDSATVVSGERADGSDQPELTLTTRVLRYLITLPMAKSFAARLLWRTHRQSIFQLSILKLYDTHPLAAFSPTSLITRLQSKDYGPPIPGPPITCHPYHPSGSSISRRGASSFQVVDLQTNWDNCNDWTDAQDNPTYVPPPLALSRPCSLV